MRKKLTALAAIALACGWLGATPAKTFAAAAEKTKSTRKQDYKKERGTPACLTWLDPDKDPQAVLLCVHGCGLHSGSFKDFGEAMAKRGVITYAVDVRGFGSFQRKQGEQNIDLNGCMWDVEETLKILHRAHPKLPIYLLGESMGGALALRVASLNPGLVSGLIASVPAGDRFKQGRTDLKVALHALTGLSRKFNIGTSIINQSTNKPELKKEWSEDPLARMQLSPLELMQFDHFCSGNLKAAKNVTSVPVLYVQGCQDQLIKPQSTMKIYQTTTCPDKWLLQIGNAEHLIFEEHQFNETIVDLVTKWIEHPLPKKDALDPNSPSCTFIPNDPPTTKAPTQLPAAAEVKPGSTP
jgi:alpha-beta hydrolase superfamily lysophospholipase